ncbi:predicted protein [Lichtheimia corymbifera JMRC:FSU:9682]|uniref:Uncharacterized protein n=1 Tax=Lichtheimia corymbifera JMRC:FSU:9682 TaxID=1263082 RepID=A0A068SEK9_9FUNG|nr:predicted protein [Lichtheimia corymbifera JMRC:FSU:9682]
MQGCCRIKPGVDAILGADDDASLEFGCWTTRLLQVLHEPVVHYSIRHRLLAHTPYLKILHNYGIDYFSCAFL